jgi:hypothetical protein
MNLVAELVDQDAVVDIVDEYILNEENWDLDASVQWAVKHLITGLRKRIDPDSANCYVPCQSEIQDDWINDTFSPATKVDILDMLDDDFWGIEKLKPLAAAVETFRHANLWGRMMLIDSLQPNGHPAEPSSPILEAKSALHKGIYD